MVNCDGSIAQGKLNYNEIFVPNHKAPLAFAGLKRFNGCMLKYSYILVDQP